MFHAASTSVTPRASRASLKEHLILLEALQCEVIERTPEAFYYLARPTFVKDEGGGSKWIGTGGTFPFGNWATIPRARIGGESNHDRALKVWEARKFKNLDSTRELGTRNMKRYENSAESVRGALPLAAACAT